MSEEEHTMTDGKKGNGQQYPDTTGLWGCDPLTEEYWKNLGNNPYWTGQDEPGQMQPGELYKIQADHAKAEEALEVGVRRATQQLQDVDVYKSVDKKVF
jgi:hypothetical protein